MNLILYSRLRDLGRVPVQTILSHQLCRFLKVLLALVSAPLAGSIASSLINTLAYRDLKCFANSSRTRWLLLSTPPWIASETDVSPNNCWMIVVARFASSCP